MLWFAAGAAAGFLAGALWASRRALAARGQAEDRARLVRQQEQAALVGTIASGIAHEIRNPLSTLRMNLQLLREDWEDPITEREQKGKKRIDILLRETGRLDTVVADFLRFAGGHALRLERGDLNALAAELLDFLGPQAERSRIRLVRDFQRGLPPVDVDAGLLRQALMNVLVNAQQALSTGGSIRVRTFEDGPWVKIEVADDGPGIAPEHLERIFTLYFSTKPGGTGLGLPMVKKIVEEHGGAVEVRSEPGKGAVFTLCLKKPAS